LLDIADKLQMDCTVGQKVYIKEELRSFRLHHPSSGEIISLDNDQELVLVRFPDDHSSYFTEDQLITYKEKPAIAAFLLAVAFTLLFSFIFIYSLRLN